jgi:UDP-GlcNAc3NAcA epimerase
MPEEINRIMADHVSTLLFSPTATGIKNLVREGFRKETKPPYTADNPAIFHCGDVMYDNSLLFAAAAERQSKILEKYQLEKGTFVLATIHRNNNTDEPQRLAAIFGTLQQIAAEENIKILMPLHPRTSGLLQKNLPADLYERIMQNQNLILAPPVSFLDMVQLEKNARLIITDSGGVQNEAYFFEKPCIILRPQTEWVELVENGTAIIADADPKKIKKAFKHFSSDLQLTFPPIFGDGKAAEFICEKIIAS